MARRFEFEKDPAAVYVTTLAILSVREDQFREAEKALKNARANHDRSIAALEAAKKAHRP